MLRFSISDTGVKASAPCSRVSPRMFSPVHRFRTRDDW